MPHSRRPILVVLALALLLTPLLGQPAVTAQPAKEAIKHILVVYLENHTFDNLYGSFPGANGSQRPESRITQVDRGGVPYATLPPVVNADPRPVVDTRFPADLPNALFPLERYVPLNRIVPSPVHRFYQHQLQMNGGRMDKYVAWTDSGALPMGYFNTADLPLYPYARAYTLADNFFTAAFGGSWLNHMWLVCACAPVFPNAPDEIVARPVYDAAGNLIDLPRDGDVTPEGYAVNDLQPFYPPYEAGTPEAKRVPPQSLPTIGDRLSAAGVAWAWYGEGWNDAVAGRPDPLFQFHHQPFPYFAAYAPGTAARADHLKDKGDLLNSLSDGTLPAVAFFKPLGEYDEHAGYAAVQPSEQSAVDLIEAVMRSRYWGESAIVVTYDDFGGWYDHVAPPVVDRWGRAGASRR